MNDPASEQNDPQPAKPKPLSATEATEFVAQIADLATAGLPLGPGLRAAAAELSRSRLSPALSRVATALDRGQSLEQALAAESQSLPRHLRALVTAGVRSGRLGLVLEEFVRFRQQVDDLRRKVWRVMAYPLLLIAMLAGIIYVYFCVFLPHAFRLREVVAGTTSRPLIQAESAEWIARHVEQLLIGAVAVVALLLFIAVLAPRVMRWCLNRAPLAGALWRLSGMAEWAELLRILLENQIPLPEALRLSAAGIRDSDLASAVRRSAARVESGALLSDAINDLPQFGEAARPIIAWGEAHSSLPAAFGAIAALSVRRLQLRADLIAAIGPPAIFILVTAVVLFTLQLPGAVVGWLASSSLIGYPPGSRSAELEWPAPSFSGALSLVALGCALLVGIKMVYGRRRRPDQPQVVMRVAGWLLIAVGMLGMLGVLWGEIGVTLWLIGLVCWGGAVFRFRRSQQFMQLNLLAVAADCGIPLEPVVRAMGDEEGGVYYMRATALADRLAAGTQLALAIQANPKTLPRQAFVAARIGEVAGAIGPALRTVDLHRNRPSGEAGATPIRASSLFYIVFVFCGLALFMGLKVSRQFRFIFKDFHRELPASTESLFNVLSSPLFILACVVGGLMAICAAIYLAFRELGWIQFELPWLGRNGATEQASIALGLLAVVAERDAPLQPAIRFLGDSYPARFVRGRLSRAAVEVSRGGDWVAGLETSKLVQRTDGAILKAAVRVGNLAWALRESAQNMLRRATVRRAVRAQIVFPLLILAFGAVVMTFVVGWYLPLVELIKDLAQPKW